MVEVLIIADKPEELSSIKKSMTNNSAMKINLHHCDDVNSLMPFLSSRSVSLILLSLKSDSKEELSKIEFISTIIPSLPIVALIDSDDDEFGLRVISAGAEEYLIKNKIEKEITARAFRYAIERKKTSLHASESETKYKELVNLLPQIVFEMDLKGDITFANNLAFELFGFSSEDFAGRFSALDLIAPKDRPRALENIKRSLSGEKIKNNEYELIGKNGKTIPALIYSKVILREGKPAGLRGVIIDITERKQAEKQIQFSEQKFNKSFFNSPISMTLQDEDGLFIDVNDAFLEMTGYTREEIVGFKGRDLNLWADINEREKAQREQNATDSLKNYEFRFRKKSGEIGTGILWTDTFIVDNAKTVLSSTFDITAKKRAEAALLSSEFKYTKIFNDAPVGIYQSTLDGKFLRVNDRLVQILGYGSKEELLQCNLENDIYFDKEDRLKSIYAYQNSDDFADIELCWKKKDGNPVWVQLTATGFKDNSGNILYFDGFIRDVSEKREAELNLRENQKLLSTVIQNIPVGIFLLDNKGKIVHANSAGQLIWGGVKYVGPDNYDEYTGWFAATGERIQKDQWGAARAITKGEHVINEEIEIETFEGKKKLIYHSAVPILNSKKEITGAIVVNQDITQQRVADLQVKRLSRAVEQSPVSVVITDTSGMIQYVNPKFEKVTGYTLAESIGKNPRFLKSGYTSPATYKEMWDTIKTGNEWRGEFHNISKKGDKFWELSVISPIRNSSGKITNFLAVKEDITEQKKMTLELISAKERAEHSDNLKTEFLAQMSHEVRTPLNVLLSFSTYIKDELESRQHLTEDLKGYFNTVSEAGKRIIRTIELILNMSDVKSGSYAYNPAKTDIVGEILKQVFYQFSHIAEEKSLRFELIQNCDIIYAFADHYSVEQILIQLISNAVKFTDSGHIKIFVNRSAAGSLEIKIEDTGVGISGEYMNKLYTPFSQEDQGFSRTFEGNGLGLALAKKYCELNGIDIHVESEKGKGTTFTLTFPSLSN